MIYTFFVAMASARARWASLCSTSKKEVRYFKEYWRELGRKTEARSQVSYPNGIGVRHSLYCIQVGVGHKPLYKCSRDELVGIINRSRREYKLLKTKKPQ